MGLDDLISKLNKKGRAFPVTYANAEDSPCVVSGWISTGCLALDAIMGGGLPIGRIVEIYGDSSTGKTLVAEMAVLTALEAGYIVLYIDTERAVSIELMEEIGIDTSKLLYADPDTMEEVFTLMEDVLMHKEKDATVLIVWDSIAATTVEQERDSEYGKATVGRHALVMSQGLRKFNRLISKHQASAMFVNQTRQKIGVMFGDDEATFGGKAVEFYSSIRIRLKKGKKLKDGKSIIGLLGNATIVKNKVARPFLSADLPIYFGEGVDDVEASLMYLKALGTIDVRGSWSYITIDGEEQKFQSTTWEDLYDAHYEEISKIVLGEVDDE